MLPLLKRRTPWLALFFMNLGFALVESGFCRAKNTVNILSKNFIVFAISCLAFYVLGWGLMFGNGSGLVGWEGLLLLNIDDRSARCPFTPASARWGNDCDAFGRAYHDEYHPPMMQADR